MDIIKIVMIGIIGAFLSVAIKKQSPEISMLTGIITGVLVFLFLLSKLSVLIDMIKKIGNMGNISYNYILILFKVIAISYIAEFGTQICNDVGEKSIGSKIELGGKIIILMISAPLLISLLELVVEMI